MATKGKRNPADQAPISSHPAFPAIVALWFAALFGIGSMVLPVVLLERLVTAGGIASLAPAAAPPLGVTVRILIALVAAGFGMVLGAVLARRVAAAQVGQPNARREPRLRAADAHPDAPVKLPISAREELGSDTLDDPFDDYVRLADRQFAEPTPDRRRALSMAEESGGGEFLDSTLLPDGDDEDALEFEHLELAVPEKTAATSTARDVPDATAAAFAAAEPGTSPTAGSAARQRPSPPAPVDGSLAELSIAQLVERFALALQAKAAEAPVPSDAPSGSESGPGNEGFAPAALSNPPVGRPDPDETEKALREALEKLQRMSGAA